MRAFLLISFLLYVSVSQAQVVTTTADAGPGSLRQAIIDANAGQTTGQIVFNIPNTDAGFDTQRGVFVIVITAELPAINRARLVIDGHSQTNFTGNTNATTLGSGGTVGTDALPLPQIDGPEVELVGNASIMHGLLVAAEGVQIRGLAIHSFGKSRGSRSGNIVIDKSGHAAVIEGNCLGTLADQLDPQTNRGCNVAALKADRVIVRNNIVVGADIAGIYITDGANDWLIEGNEIADNNRTDDRLDGIDLALSQGGTVRGNRIAHNGGNGIDTYRAIGRHTIVNNTIVGNGQQGVEVSGVRLYGVDNEVRHNIIADNTGSGILVTSAAARNQLTQNAIYDNGSASAATDAPIGIDLIRAEENHESGSAPFVTLNDQHDWDEGGNGLLNQPIIDQAMIQGDSVKLSGWATAGATLEFFVGDQANVDRPQGKTYLFSLTEGSAQDRDATQGSYDLPGTWGSDTTHRFAITLPLTGHWQEGIALVATATLDNATSEFGPKAVLTRRRLMPIAGCRQQRSDGTYEVFVGYRNHTTDTITVNEGHRNSFVARAGTPPTVFYPGTHLNVASVRVDSTGGRWILENQSLALTVEQPTCPIDLSLTMMASEDLVQPGDTVWVTTQLENLSTTTAFEVDVAVTVPAHAVLLQAQSTQGAYDAATGLWSVGDLTTDQVPELLFQLIINENTLVEGLIDTTDQPDDNAINDRATAHIAIDPSTSGEDGGTESNGNLASKIAVRNFQRQQQLVSARRVAPKVFSHQKVRSGAITTASSGAQHARAANHQADLLLIPEQSPGSHQAVVVTPEDLIGITNADELFSVDYLNERSQILGSVLYIRTAGQVYEHTKAICDRLNGGALTDIRHVNVLDKPFILSRIDQPNGEIDYAINFVAYETPEGYTVDNRWRNEAYRPAEGASVLNFQVWSVSPTHTIALATQLLRAMQQKSLSFLNNYPPTIPSVYVKSGHYSQGQLHLKLQNRARAAQADVWGTAASTEDGERASFLTSVPLAAGEQILSLPVDQVFDVGFTLANSATGGLDALYLADGPWGVDYERDGAQVTNFATETGLTNPADGVYPLERSAQMTGQVRSYASLFRSLRPGLLPQNLQAYGYLAFQASGTGQYEVIVTKKSIEASGEQFRHFFTLSGEGQDFAVPFGSLTNRLGERAGAFTAEDVTSVVFNALGNGRSSQPFDLRVDNLTFQTQAYGNREEQRLSDHVRVFPNPAHDRFTVSVSQQVPNETVTVSLLDLSGRSLQVVKTGTVERNGHWHSELPLSVAPGVYLLKVTTSHGQSISKLIKQ